MAYFLVHSFANSWYFPLSDLYSLKEKILRGSDTHAALLHLLNAHLAISGTRGSSGLGSHSREQMERSTLETVRAGDHWDLPHSAVGTPGTRH